MRRRHLRSVLRIEAQVYPRPWSLPLFMSELNLRTSRAYYVARIDGTVGQEQMPLMRQLSRLVG